MLHPPPHSKKDTELRAVVFFIVGDVIANIGITYIWHNNGNVALIRAYGKEFKALRKTALIGLIITAATIIPLMSFLIWP